ncbi:MAG: hypothetical protein D6736_15860, partial [Nitrospinota bacterium]
IITSDHGASTIIQAVDVPQILADQGFVDLLQDGAMQIGRCGGASLIYLSEEGKTRLPEVIHFLQKQAWTGPLFTTYPLPGTLPLSLIHNANDRAADILFSLHWQGRNTSTPVPGVIASDSTIPAGSGMHGSFSPFEMHNYWAARGPDFAPGRISYVPSGSIDLVPTILSLLQVPLPPDLDGRVLVETLRDGPAPEELWYERRIIRSERADSFSSLVQLSAVQGVTYFDKGMAKRD